MHTLIMKKNQFFPVIIFIAFCLQACTSNDAKTYNEKAALPSLPTTSIPGNNIEGGTTLSIPQDNGTNLQSTSGTPNPPHGQPGHRCGEAEGTATAGAPAISPSINSISPLPAPVALANTGSAGSKLNPAHGQPGHNCAIAVGAPLNGAPQTSSPVTAPLQKTAPVTQTTVAPAAAVKTAPGMNPAHGQPGHRCDISVGAPLNSKPAPAAVSATTTTAPAATNPSPLKPATTLSEVFPDVTKKSTEKLNPAHGQPGHDCKIAVGQPLKQ